MYQWYFLSWSVVRKEIVILCLNSSVNHFYVLKFVAIKLQFFLSSLHFRWHKFTLWLSITRAIPVHVTFHAVFYYVWTKQSAFTEYDRSQQPGEKHSGFLFGQSHIQTSSAGWGLSLFFPALLWIYSDSMENMVFRYKLISLYIFVVRISQQSSSLLLWTDKIPSIVCEAYCVAVIPIELFL